MSSTPIIYLTGGGQRPPLSRMDPEMRRRVQERLGGELTLPQNDDPAILALLRTPPQGHTQSSVVHRVVLGGRIDLVQRAVEEGCIPPGIPVGAVASLVHIAAAHGHVPLLRCLIVDKGVNLNAPCAAGARPLHFALAKQRTAACAFLIQEAPGIDVNIETVEGKNPLSIAAERGTVEVMRCW